MIFCAVNKTNHKGFSSCLHQVLSVLMSCSLLKTSSNCCLPQFSPSSAFGSIFLVDSVFMSMLFEILFAISKVNSLNLIVKLDLQRGRKISDLITKFIACGLHFHYIALIISMSDYGE